MIELGHPHKMSSYRNSSTKVVSLKPKCISPNINSQTLYNKTIMTSYHLIHVTAATQYVKYFDWCCTGFSFTKYTDDHLTKTLF
jgi:hypothetical protein